MKLAIILLAALAMGAACEDVDRDDDGGGGDTGGEVDTGEEEWCEEVVDDCLDDYDDCLLLSEIGPCLDAVCDCITDDDCADYTAIDC